MSYISKQPSVSFPDELTPPWIAHEFAGLISLDDPESEQVAAEFLKKAVARYTKEIGCTPVQSYYPETFPFVVWHVVYMREGLPEWIGKQTRYYSNLTRCFTEVNNLEGRSSVMARAIMRAHEALKIKPATLNF